MIKKKNYNNILNEKRDIAKNITKIEQKNVIPFRQDPHIHNVHCLVRTCKCLDLHALFCHLETHPEIDMIGRIAKISK